MHTIPDAITAATAAPAAPPPEDNPSAESRVRSALRAIVDAQRLIDEASYALCSVDGLRPEWDGLAQLYTQARRSWRAIHEKADALREAAPLTLTDEPTALAAKWASCRRVR